MSVLVIVSDHEEAKFLLKSIPGCAVEIVGGYPFQVRQRSATDVAVGVSGVGVIPATLCAVAGINRFNPSAIIVAGTAGGIAGGVKVGTVAIPSEVRFAPTAAGGTLLGIASSEVLTEQLRSHYHQLHEEYVIPAQAPPEISGHCLTVCTEVVDGREAEALREAGISIVEMEGYGVYSAAKQAGVPCAMVRYVADLPGSDDENDVAAGLGASAVDAVLLRFFDSFVAAA